MIEAGGQAGYPPTISAAISGRGLARWIDYRDAAGTPRQYRARLSTRPRASQSDYSHHALTDHIIFAGKARRRR